MLPPVAFEPSTPSTPKGSTASKESFRYSEELNDWETRELQSEPASSPSSSGTTVVQDDTPSLYDIRDAKTSHIQQRALVVEEQDYCDLTQHITRGGLIGSGGYAYVHQGEWKSAHALPLSLLTSVSSFDAKLAIKILRPVYLLGRGKSPLLVKVFAY